ncbi:hypothetical protein ACOSQ2_005102 [Xanthoceras sorbifolium]
MSKSNKSQVITCKGNFFQNKYSREDKRQSSEDLLNANNHLRSKALIGKQLHEEASKKISRSLSHSGDMSVSTVSKMKHVEQSSHSRGAGGLRDMGFESSGAAGNSPLYDNNIQRPAVKDVGDVDACGDPPISADVVGPLNSNKINTCHGTYVDPISNEVGHPSHACLHAGSRVGTLQGGKGLRMWVVRATNGLDYVPPLGRVGISLFGQTGEVNTDHRTQLKGGHSARWKRLGHVGGQATKGLDYVPLLGKVRISESDDAVMDGKKARMVELNAESSIQSQF